MRILVIPDIHLKPWMFDRAQAILEAKDNLRAVCLMDIPDDWNKQFYLDLYQQTFDRAAAFAASFPDTLWCFGNHDLCYEWNMRETGYSAPAAGVVVRGLSALRRALPSQENIAYLHKIDNVLFSHGGLSDVFVREYIPSRVYHDADEVLRLVNAMSCAEMWSDISPIWYRPQYEDVRMYKPRKFLQVVGHTPVNRPIKFGSVLCCDTFSTYRDGTKFGNNEFVIVDTVTKEWESLS